MRSITSIKGRDVLVASIYSLAFFAFSLVLLFIYKSGMPGLSRAFTVPFRAVVLGLSLICIAYFLSRKELVIGKYQIAVLVFWLLYIIRILYDGLFFGYTLGKPWQDYFQQAIGVTLIPSFALCFALDRRDNFFARWSFLVVLFVLCLSLLVGYRQYLGESYRTLSHFGVDSINLISPHTFSYSGAALVCIASSLVLSGLRTSLILKLLYSSMMLVGAICLFYGGSRGPLLSTGLVFLFLVVNAYRRGGLKGGFATQIVLVVLAVVAAYGAYQIVGGRIFNRMEALLSELQFSDDDAGSGRLYMWKNGFDQFLENPIFGSGLEEHVSRYVVHNVYLEAFMATGILGGILFLYLAFFGVIMSWRLIGVVPELGWLCALYMQRFFNGFFSLQINDILFWGPLIAVSASYYVYYVKRKGQVAVRPRIP